MTPAERMAKARAAKKSNLESLPESESKAEEVIPEMVIVAGEVLPAQEEYGDAVLVTEPHKRGARVVVLKLGVCLAEWHGELFECMESAKNFVDTGNKTGAVDVNAYF